METEAETVAHQVTEAEMHLARAEELLANMERAGHDNAAQLVRETIETFRITLAAHRHHLAILRREDSR